MKNINSLLTLAALAVNPLFAEQNPKGVTSPKETSTTQSQPQTNQGPYSPQDFSYLLGMSGFSDVALKMHFKLYQGYVTNTNLILSLLHEGASEGKMKSPVYAELKRRFMWEFDGMRLHEYYFGNLGGKGTKLSAGDALAKQIEQDFGSFDRWKADFISTGSMRGIGWAVLYRDPITGRLLNLWIGEHDLGHLAGGTPLVIMDVFEHAYLPDYGLDRGKYIEAFFDNLNWDVASKRYTTVLSGS